MGIVFGEWSFGPDTWVLVAVLVLHEVGYLRRQQVVADRTKASYANRRYRMWTFLAAVAVLIVALDSPVDYYSATLFWVHMIQHILLMVVAAPLLVLSAPWLILLRGLPPVPRRTVSRLALGGRGLAPLRALGRALNRPLVAWLLFVINVWVWHRPGPYDLTLSNVAVHYFEHGLFFGLGVLFWLQVIDSYPLRSRLSYIARVAYLVAFALQNWVLAMGLAFASGPWYSGYAHLLGRAGGISALEDQQIGAGIMWIPGMIPVAITVGALATRFVSNRNSRDVDRELDRLIDAETRLGRLPVPRRWRLTLAPRHHLD